ncbi:MAG: gp53-like domain-containing protein [Aeromonas jandaei]
MGQIFNNFNRPHHDKPFIEKPDPFIAMNTYDELGEIRSRTGIAIRDLDQRMDDFIGEINTTVDASKIDITNHTNAEIVRITKHTDGKIVEITNHTDTKKNEITDLTTAKKTEIINLTNTSKNEISTLTANSKKEISDLRDSSIADITNHTNTKKTEITNHTETKKTEITSHTNAKKVELDNYEKTKETQLNEYTNTKQTQLDQYEKAKEEELNTFTDTKKAEITSHTSSKITEITNHTDSKKTEITTHTNEKKAELDKYEKAKEDEIDVYVSEKKVEITNHTDAELERISATGIDTKLSIDVYNVDKTAMEAEINKKVDNTIYQSDKSTIENNINTLGSKTITAGKGLTGGGSVSSAPTINIVSADEGIIVNDDNIKLNVVDNLVDGGVKKALSAEQGKVLKQLIDTLGTGGALQLLRTAQVFSSYDYLGELPANGSSIMVGTVLYKPTLYLDGTRMDKNQYNVDLNTGLITLNVPYSEDYPVVWVVEDEMPHHIKFAYPTMNMLINDSEVVSKINIGDIVEILGASDADDGGHYLVKCEDIAKLNAVDIGGGRLLNEIPNTRISDKVSKNGDTINGTLVATDFVAKQYFKIKDFYGGDTNANMWFNENRSGFSPKSVYIYDALNMYLGSSGRVYHTENKPTAAEIGAMPITGGSFTGSVSIPDGKVLVTSNNYGIMGRRTDGVNKYILLMDTANRLSVGWANEVPIFLASTDIKDYNSNPVFTGTNCPCSLAQRGYAKFANGLIIQWGRDKVTTANASNTINYPTAFSNGSVALATSNGWAGAPYGVNAMVQLEVGNSATFQASSPTAGSYFGWIAIGF